MATANPKELRKTAIGTLNYMFRGEGHEHEVNSVVYIGGNTINHPELINGEFELQKLNQEYEETVTRHTGKGSHFYKHYVISLAEGETLTDEQWFDVCSEYMTALGYDESCAWTACKHLDSNCEHVHILGCRVKRQPGGELVKDSLDYEKGWDVMRKTEQKYSLKQLINPDENFGINLAKHKIKTYGSREKALTNDDASQIRKALGRVWNKYGTPPTITHMVSWCANEGVSIKARANDSGEVLGISYSYQNGPFISGSKVKSTRFTWNKLLKKEKISYRPERDNAALGLSPVTSNLIALVEISDEQYERLLMLQEQLRVREFRERYILEIKLNKPFKPNRFHHLLEIINSLTELIFALFGSPPALLWEDNNWYNNYTNKVRLSYEPDEAILISTDSVNEVRDGVVEVTKRWINEPNRYDHEENYGLAL